MATYFSEDHEWVTIDGATATIGITPYAAEQLGDVVFVELPEVGTAVEAKAQFAVVESVKAASEVYAPIAGVVAEVNEVLENAPEMVNEDPSGAGWFAKFTVETPDVSHLMDADAYAEYLKGL